MSLPIGRIPAMGLTRNAGRIKVRMGKAVVTIKEAEAKLYDLRRTMNGAHYRFQHKEFGEAAAAYENTAKEYLAIGAKLHGVSALLDLHACYEETSDTTNMGRVYKELIRLAPSEAREARAEQNPELIVLDIGGEPMAARGVVSRLAYLRSLSEEASDYLDSCNPLRAARNYEDVAQGYFEVGAQLHGLREASLAYNNYVGAGRMEEAVAVMEQLLLPHSVAEGIAAN